MAGLYAELARAGGLTGADLGDAEAVEALVAGLMSFLELSGLPTSLEGVVPAGSVTMLAEEAAGQWTAGFNPRDVDAAALAALYRAAGASAA